MADRYVLISNGQGYGDGYYGDGYYGGFDKVVIDDTWDFKKRINSQEPFTYTIIDNPNNLTITKGLETVFMVGGERKFQGIIHKIEPYEDTYNKLHYYITAVTFEKLAEKHQIGYSFSSKSTEYIVKYIIDNYLYKDGISYGTIQEGPTFDIVTFNYCSCKDALNKLQLAAPGYNWYIDFDKKLHFYQKATNKCSTVIDNSFQHNGFRPVDTLDEYRNSQYIEGGMKETLVINNYTPSPKPDGESRTFTVKFGIAKQPVIETNVNGAGWVTQTVGISGFDTGKQFYWKYGDNTIVQDDSETVLTDTNPTPDQIRITFYGLTKVRIKYDDVSKIAERASIEGNSGIYEEVFQNTDINSNAAAVNYAKGLIEKYSDQNYITLIVEEDIGDIDINKLIKVEKPIFNIDDWYLVESIKAKQQNADEITYEIKLLSGEFVGSWEDYFKSLLTQQTNILSDDSIVFYYEYKDEYNWQGTYNLQKCEVLVPEVTLSPSVTLSPGTTVSEITLYD